MTRRPPRDQEMDELRRELEAHLALEAEDRREAGAAPEEARYAARRDLGNSTAIQETVYEMGTSIPFEPWMKDVRHALRGLRREPVFAVTAVLLLALGIGANTAIFTVADRMLLRLLPIPDPGQVALLTWDGEFIGGSSRGWQQTFSYPALADFQKHAPPEVVGIAARRQEMVAVRSGSAVERSVAELVSGNYFEVLGAGAQLGRTLTPADDELRDAEPYVVLSHDYWRTRFGADPSILNKEIAINGYPMTVVGVTRPGFRGFDALSPSDVFVPLSMKGAVTPTWDHRDRRDSIWLEIFTRLRNGVTIGAAQAALAGPYQSILRQDLAAKPKGADFEQRYLRNRVVLLNASQGMNDVREYFSQPLYILFAMVGTLLLIACVNIANLMVTRAARRQREIAIRVSLGATKGSLVRLVLSESLLLALAGGALGLLLSGFVADQLMRMIPYERLGTAVDTNPDWRVLAFTAGLSLLTALAFGIFPAIQAARADSSPALKSESRSATLARPQTNLRRFLVAVQVALSLVLLVGAGLFSRSLHNIFTVDSGIQSSHLMAFSIDPSQQRYSPERADRLFLDLRSRLEALPGVVSASAAAFPLLADTLWQNTVTVEGHTAKENEDMQAGWNQVMPGFFSTAGVPLLAGREFTAREIRGAPGSVIVNEHFARRFFGDARSAVGRRVGFGGHSPLTHEIVGVVKDLKGSGLKEAKRPWTFTPALQNGNPGEMTFYVLTRGEPEALLDAARRTVSSLDASVPVYDLKTVDRQIEETHFTEILFARLSTAFAGIATLLASVGLYGVTAFMVARRTQEIGIRMALGAAGRNVIQLVLGEVLLLAALGLAAGVPLSFGVSRLVESLLYGIRGYDVPVAAVAVALLAAVSIVAGCVPAWRATRIDPVHALRHE